MASNDLHTVETPEWLSNCPLVFDWCEYKGETYFGAINYERSIKAKRPMIDLSYCATKALNCVILKTVAWNNKKFDLKPKQFN